jgi:hypothetical protein
MFVRRSVSRLELHSGMRRGDSRGGRCGGSARCSLMACATAQRQHSANLKMLGADSKNRGLQFRAGGYPRAWYSDVGQDEVDYMTGLAAKCEAQGYSERNAARVDVYRQ